MDQLINYFYAGSELQEVLHCQWCVELWSSDVRDMESGTQAIWSISKYAGVASLPGCTRFYFAQKVLERTLKLVLPITGGADGEGGLPAASPTRVPPGSLPIDDKLLVRTSVLHTLDHSNILCTNITMLPVHSFCLITAGNPRPAPVPRFLTCCSPSPDQRQSSSAGLRRTHRHTHRLPSSGDPWMLE